MHKRFDFIRFAKPFLIEAVLLAQNSPQLTQRKNPTVLELVKL